MSDGTKEAIEFSTAAWGVLSGIGGALITAIGIAMKFGGQLKSFATHEEVDDKIADCVSKESFNDFKTDTKTDLIDIKGELREERRVNNERHGEIMREFRKGASN